MSYTIVKVQRRLAGTPADPHLCLVYGRGRANMREQVVTNKVFTALRDEPLAYFEAAFSDGVWQIFRRVPDQRWSE